RLTDELVGRGQDRADGRHLEVVEVQHDVGQQDAPMAGDYLSPGGWLGHIEPYNLLDQRSIVVLANLSSDATEVLDAGGFGLRNEVPLVFRQLAQGQRIDRLTINRHRFALADVLLERRVYDRCPLEA